MPTPETDRLGIGGNQGPPLTITDRLAEEHDELDMHVLEIAARANKAPKEITDDAMLADVGRLARDVVALGKRIEETRKKAKEPSLQEGREVDAFFQRWVKEDRDVAKCGRVTRIAKSMLARMDAYQRSKAAATRAHMAWEAEQRAIRERVEREKAEVARQAGKPEEAAAFDQQGDVFAGLKKDAEERASGRAADLVRHHSGDVTVSAKEEWVFEITDPDAVNLNLLRGYLREEVVRAAIAAFVKAGGRELAGVTIRKEMRSIVR